MKKSDLVIDKAKMLAEYGPARADDGTLAIGYDFESPSSLIKTKADAYVRGWTDALRQFVRSCNALDELDVRRDR